MKNKIFKEIIKYIDKHDILYDYDTYEQMPIIYHFDELECLKDFVSTEYNTIFCINMAIMYINQGILHAKSKLSEEEFNNYIMYFILFLDKGENGVYDAYERVDVAFSRKGKEDFKSNGKKVNVKKTKAYKFVKDVIGISEFSCYCCKLPGFYIFVPRIFEERFS